MQMLVALSAEMFEVRIHCIDYCLAAPTDVDRTASRAPLRQDDQQPDAEYRVPIIRVFGATSGGSIACAHIHGVFPYLFVPYDTHFSFAESDRVVASLRHGIDQAVGRAVVLAITLVRGVPFYGFHVGLRLFLKIYLLDPAVVSRVAEMLRQGRFAGLPPMLPHESHVPFVLQFMTDYNLYGCDILRAAAVTRRSKKGRGSCPLEVDIAACHIRNRDAVPERSQHESIPEVPAKTGERLVYSMASLWREVAGKYSKKGTKTAEERRAWELASTQDAFAQLAASSSDPRRTPLAWPHDAQYHKHIADMIAAEDASETAPRPRDPLEEAVQTTRQSVEDFYPTEERFERKKRKRQSDGLELPAEKEVRLSPSPELEREPRVVTEKHELRRERPLTQTFSVVKSASPRNREKPARPATAGGMNDAVIPSSLDHDKPSTTEEVVKTMDQKQEARIRNAGNALVKDAMDMLGADRPERRTVGKWTFACLPPSFEDVEVWLAEEETRRHAEEKRRGESKDSARRQMSAARMPKRTREVGRKAKPGIRREMSVLVLEMHANSREGFLPNPERDAVQCVVWRATDATGAVENGTILVRRTVGKEFGNAFCVDVVADEQELLQHVVQLVHRLDPDILSGYEIAAASWGYLQERVEVYEEDLWAQLGRVEQKREAALHERSQCVTGRHMLAVGEALRASVDLRQYTLENTAWEVLSRRVPAYTAQVLTGWVAEGSARALGRVVRHYRRRTAVSMALLEATDLVAQTCEQARVLGIDFASVLGRGSQFKVESVMLRVAKPENYVLPSPSHEQVGQQKAAEVAPLVLEPRSALYKSPVVVLDFASLYPSLMIAYNLCYSTYIGQADEGFGSKTGSKMGFTTYARPPGLLARLTQSTRSGVVVTPTGTMFVGAQTRQSLLAKMLSEILNTRVMVKTALRTAKNAAGNVDAGEQRRLHNRQLALKLLANVTYGYTSASFSGRMPCVELADSIVETGRQTLDRAIALIHAEPRWAAEVVYGDTDSLFVHLPGRTREQAFALGAEMAEAVTASNPHPVRLKVEKVYQPCVLLAKKRYVGYQFETAAQAEPVLDAKGIETVRRDGSPAAARLLEDVLRLLFDTADLDRVKACVQTRLDDVLQGRLSPVDLCFARHVRGGPDAYHAPPPGAVLAARRAAYDPRAALLSTGKRVPFVVVAGPPGVALRDRCVSPQELVHNRHLRLDADYYIRRSLLPPLDRILRLVGVDVTRWYADMPRARMPLRVGDPAPSQPQPQSLAKQPTLDTWLRESQCARCDQPVQRVQQGDAAPPPLCRSCAADPHTLTALQCRLRDAEAAYRAVLDDCRSCAGLGPHDEMRCTNLTCTRYFVRAEHAVKARAEQAKAPLTALLVQRAMQDLQW